MSRCILVHHELLAAVPTKDHQQQTTADTKHLLDGVFMHVTS